MGRPRAFKTLERARLFINKLKLARLGLLGLLEGLLVLVVDHLASCPNVFHPQHAAAAKHLGRHKTLDIVVDRTGGSLDLRQRGRAGRKEYSVESPGRVDGKEKNGTIETEERNRRGGRRQEPERRGTKEEEK